MMNGMNEVTAFLRQHQSFCLIAHVSPDGDTLGSCLSFARILRKLEKTVSIVCADPVPDHYRTSCVGWEEIRTPEQITELPEAVIAVDCAAVDRLGSAKALFEAVPCTMCVDHHETNTGFAGVNYVQNVAANGENIFTIAKALGVEPDREAAALLYVALAADTGNFSFKNTTSETFRITSELMKTGFDLPELNRALFHTKPYCKLKVHALGAEKCRLYREGTVAVTALSKRDIEICGAAQEHVEGLIDDLRDVDTVELAAVLRETEDGSIRVSMRGKKSADVSAIAQQFGGGGHRLAAGCTIHAPLEEAEEMILRAALRVMDETVLS